jgi:hypothetical protein
VKRSMAEPCSTDRRRGRARGTGRRVPGRAHPPRGSS